MKFDFIHAEKARYSIAALCRALGVSRSGVYAHRGRGESVRSRDDRKLLVAIQAAFVENRHVYGSPRIRNELRVSGWSVGRRRIARLMRVHGIQARYRRRFVRTTIVDPGLPVAPNTLARRFRPPAPDRVWAADITYVRTYEGWLYLAVVLDLYSRRVVGWATSARIDGELAAAALTMAVERRSPSHQVLHHSDRGCQYTSWNYQRALKGFGISSSMSRKGNCWDNAVVESFFATLKTELVHRMTFTGRAQAQSALFDYIETFYNPKRQHSALEYLSPAQYELRWRAGRQAA